MSGTKNLKVIKNDYLREWRNRYNNRGNLTYILPISTICRLVA